MEDRDTGVVEELGLDLTFSPPRLSALLLRYPLDSDDRDLALPGAEADCLGLEYEEDR